jgi:hypothetical protein
MLDMVKGLVLYIPPIIKPLTFKSLLVLVLNSSSYINRASYTLLDNHFIPAQAFSTLVVD